MPSNLNELAAIVNGLDSIRQRIAGDLTLPEENKPRLLEQARQKEIERLKEGARNVLQQAGDRVAATRRGLELARSKADRALDPNRVLAYQTRVAGQVQRARTVAEVEALIEQAQTSGDRELLQAWYDAGLPKAQERFKGDLHEATQAHGLESKLQDAVWATLPDFVKEAVGNVAAATKDFQATREIIVDISLKAGGPTAYHHRLDPLREVYAPDGGIFGHSSAEQAQESAPAPTTIFG